MFLKVLAGYIAMIYGYEFAKHAKYAYSFNLQFRADETLIHVAFLIISFCFVNIFNEREI